MAPKRAPPALKFLIEIAKSIGDPRVEGRCAHKLIDVVVIAFCAILCGADGCVEIAAFGRARERWLRKFLKLPNGIPSHDTFLRVFSLIDSNELEHLFLAALGMAFKTKKTHLSFDGKSIAGTERNRLKRPLHLVNVFSHDHGVSLGHSVANNSGFGERSAVFDCFPFFDLRGSLISFDAAITSPQGAFSVREAGAHYLMPVKNNLKLFKDPAIKAFKEFERKSPAKVSCASSQDFGHQRSEKRSCKVISSSALTEGQRSYFKDCARLILITRTRENLSATIAPQNRKIESTTLYVSSKKIDAEEALAAARRHWGIENRLHWSLDVSFNEDKWTVRQRAAVRNLAALRKLAFNLLKQDPTKGSVRVKKKSAGWSTDILEGILERIVGSTAK